MCWHAHNIKVLTHSTLDDSVVASRSESAQFVHRGVVNGNAASLSACRMYVPRESCFGDYENMHKMLCCGPWHSVPASRRKGGT
jgi:hypothetical protein